MGLFFITAFIGEVTYYLDLKGWVTLIHAVFSCELASQVYSRR